MRIKAKKVFGKIMSLYRCTWDEDQGKYIGREYYLQEPGVLVTCDGNYCTKCFADVGEYSKSFGLVFTSVNHDCERYIWKMAEELT